MRLGSAPRGAGADPAPELLGCLRVSSAVDELEMGNAGVVEIVEEGPARLLDYARISIAFQVSEIADVTEATTAGGGFAVSQRKLRQGYLKDYDQLPGAGPLQWPQRFDLSNWGLFAAYLAGRRVGGATVAFDTPGVDMLEGRRDLAVLWDLRVDPRARGRDVGSALFRAVERWARARACQTLKIETQNTNLPACRFYARQGCSLRKTKRSAYPELPDEVQMLWYKSLAAND